MTNAKKRNMAIPMQCAMAEWHKTTSQKRYFVWKTEQIENK